MAEPKMNELAEELLRLSRERKVTWEEVPRRTDSYRVFFPDVTLIVSRERRAFTKPPNAPALIDFQYQLDVLGHTGRIVDSLITKPQEPMYQALGEIFDLAKGYVRDRGNRGIDKALDFLKSR